MEIGDRIGGGRSDRQSSSHHVAAGQGTPDRRLGQDRHLSPIRQFSTVQLSVLIGTVFGLVAVFGGFGQLLVVALFGGIGLAVGLALEGRLDLRSLTNLATRR